MKKTVNAVNENLKRSLLAKRPLPTFSPEDSDETDIDTNLDFYDNSQRWPRKRKAVIEDSEEESSPSTVGGAVPVQEESGRITYTLLDEATAKAIKELPSVLSKLKDILEGIHQKSICRSPTMTSDEAETFEVPEMIALAGSDIKIAKKLYDRLNSSRVSLFVQDLAALVFGKDCLRNSTLTGRSGKEQLDPHKVNAIVDTARERFPGTSISEIRSLLRRKCNNESYSKRPTEDKM